MKRFKLVTFIVLFLLMSVSVMGQDKFKFGFDYERTSLKPNFEDPLSDVNSVRINGLIRVAGVEKDGFKLNLGGEVQKSFDKQVFSDYQGTGMNIYRDVYTYYGLGELAYRYKFIEVGARAKLGAEKLHEDLDYDFTRAYEFRGTLVAGPIGITPLFIGFKREPQGFVQYFGAGGSYRF